MDYSFTKTSENNHKEKPWIHFLNENNIQERIIQFHYQLVRLSQSNLKQFNNNTIHTNIITLEYKLNDILSYLKQNTQQNHFLFHLTFMYKLIAYTRDIHEGKGERLLTYMQIYTWFKYFPDLTKYMILRLVYYVDDFDYQDYSFGIRELIMKNNYNTKKAFGSWRDMKELLHYCIHKEERNLHRIHHGKKICVFISSLLCNHLFLDYDNMRKQKEVSYLAKWFPRENLKNKKLYKYIIETLNPSLLQQPYCAKHYNREASKIRKIVSSLNRYLNTTEVLMCSHQWNAIHLHDLPLSCLYQYKNIFLNTKKHIIQSKQGSTPTSLSRNTNQYKNRIELHRLVRDAIAYRENHSICQFIDNIWRTIKRDYVSSITPHETKNINQNLALLPILDASYSMMVDNHTPFYTGIAIAIFISELPNDFKDRIFTFSNSFDWINLSSCQNSFVQKVNHIINNISMGCHSSFYESFSRLIRTLSISHTGIIYKQPSFVILSDMKVNIHEKSPSSTMYENIQDIIDENKLLINPNIVFWNLRNTNGFPCKIDVPNVIMLSGYNLSNLIPLMNKNKMIYSNTPYNYVIELLNKKRYSSLEKRVVMYGIQ